MSDSFEKIPMEEKRDKLYILLIISLMFHKMPDTNLIYPFRKRPRSFKLPLRILKGKSSFLVNENLLIGF